MSWVERVSSKKVEFLLDYDKDDLIYLELVEDRFKKGYYHSLDDLLQDIVNLVANIISIYEHRLVAAYLTNFLGKVTEHLKCLKDEFECCWMDHFEKRFKLNRD